MQFHGPSSARVACALILPLALVGCFSGKPNGEDEVVSTTPKQSSLHKEKFVRGEWFDPKDPFDDTRKGYRRDDEYYRDYTTDTFYSRTVVLNPTEFFENARMLRRSIANQPFTKDGQQFIVDDTAHDRADDASPQEISFSTIFNEANNFSYFRLLKVSTSARDPRSDFLRFRVVPDEGFGSPVVGKIFGKGGESVLVLKETQSGEKNPTLSNASDWIRNISKTTKGSDLLVYGRFVITPEAKVAYVVESSFPNFKAAINYQKQRYGEAP